jgi:hypothetical protein
MKMSRFMQVRARPAAKMRPSWYKVGRIALLPLLQSAEKSAEFDELDRIALRP